MPRSGKVLAAARLQSAARLTRTALAARLSEHGFYAGQDQIMLALAGGEGQTPGQLASRLGVRPPTITKTINRLQGQGFLQKRGSEADARQSIVYLTPAGEDAIRAIEKAVRKTEKLSMKGFDKKEQKAFAKFLSRIEANLSNSVHVDGADDDADDE